MYTELVSIIFTPDEINFSMFFDLDELLFRNFLNKLNIDGGFIYSLGLRKGHWVSSGGISKLIELPIDEHFQLSSNFSVSNKITINKNGK